MVATKKPREENKHIFFSVADAWKQIAYSVVDRRAPTFSTFRRWIIKDMGLSVQKVNKGYKEAITQVYLLLKSRYIWIHRSLARGGRTMTYLNDLNEPSWQIKWNIWMKESKQKLLFWCKKEYQAKLNHVCGCRKLSKHASAWRFHRRRCVYSIKKWNYWKVEDLQSKSWTVSNIYFRQCIIPLWLKCHRTLEVDNYILFILSPYTLE